MKTTVDIPDKALKDAMRFSRAKTKREAILTAIEEYNRRKLVDEVIAMAGSFPDFIANDELEAADLEDNERQAKLWNREA